VSDIESLTRILEKMNNAQIAAQTIDVRGYDIEKEEVIDTPALPPSTEEETEE